MSDTLLIDGQEIVLDPENLRFNEDNLTLYIQTEAGYYDNFGAALSLAEKELQNKEVLHEKVYNERFVEAKDDGSSDKLAEAKAKSDAVVVAFKEDIIKAKYIVNRLKQHLRAWDKNHDNAQSLGYMLRKAMDKLGADIKMNNTNYYSSYEKTPDPPPRNSVGPAEFETNLSLDNLF